MTRPVAAAAISLNDPRYPKSLKECVDKPAPRLIHAVGEYQLLERPGVAFLCSIKCPGDVILMAYDVTRALRDAGIPMIGGFHSPIEQECFDLLLRGAQPVILALARSVEGIKLPARWRSAIEVNRLLVLSFCSSAIRRPTAETAEYRNQCIATIAEHVLVAHASQGGKLDRLTGDLLASGRSVFTFDCSANSHLIERGARPVQASGIVSLLRPS